MIKTILYIIFWCGLTAFAMWCFIGTNTIHNVIIGFVGAILMIFFISVILVTNHGRDIQHNTNKFVVDNIRKRNERTQKEQTKQLQKINERNRKL